MTIWQCATMESRAHSETPEMRRQQRDLYRDQAFALEMEAFVDSQLRLCQALDAYSRGQWDPLMRLALRSGPVGTAAELIQTARMTPYEEATVAEGLGPLQRDARGCHEESMSLLYGMAASRAGLLAANESAAYWQVLKSMYEAGTDELSRIKLQGLQAPPETEPSADVQRLVDEISARC